MRISTERVKKDPVKNRKTELVERKGLGHPDSISDAIAESVSRKLCRKYRDETGRILHHNTDEVQLVAGSSNPELGGGSLEEEIYILLAGRATKEFEGESLPVDKWAREAARNYIDENFKKLSPDHLEIDSRIGETSTDLKSVFETQGAPMSNDTSFGVGHAPLSPVEKTVKKAENRIHTEIPEVGEDVKVMGLRDNGFLKITVAAAVISSRVSSLEEYFDVKEKIEMKVLETARQHTDLEVGVDVNTADEREEDSIYLTVTGTSAEMGDDGSVGRGNRVNGLITPQRSMSLEAASGKNPVTHVGKIYNLASNQIAEAIAEETGEFAEVKMLSQIGAPIDRPQMVDVTTGSDQDVEDIVEEKVENIQDVTEKVVDGKFSTF
jgi:S-adenosylmethionine synthetase